VSFLFTAHSINISILFGISTGKNIFTAVAGQTLALETNSLYLWAPILLVSILAVIGITIPIVYHLVYKKLLHDMDALKVKLASYGEIKGIEDDDLFKIIKDAGYSYDSRQDIFYSNLDAWQRNMGFCRLYDEASAPFGMIIDCEPIYFEYDGKSWLIELWKGQYDLTTGGEIGVYTNEAPDLDIPGLFTGTFYNCASDADRLEMTFSLKRNGEKLFKRKDKHWWLTGFKLGEFSEPSELIMNIKITLKDKQMCNAFVRGLRKAGYSEDEIYIMENTVGLKFNKPHTAQPITRTKETDWIIQKKNKLLCEKYQEITSPYENFTDKINAVRQKSPEIYEMITNLGKSEQIFKTYKKIKDYLD
jgi:hypothetical protein